MEIAGTKVVNAHKGVTIKISDRDVDLGKTKDAAACAAARACMRELHATQARVHIGRTYLKIGEKWVRYRTSGALRSEIIAFDRGGSFSPGQYELHPIPPTDQGIRKNKSRKRETRRIKKRPYHTITGVRERGANR